MILPAKTANTATSGPMSHLSRVSLFGGYWEPAALTPAAPPAPAPPAMEDDADLPVVAGLAEDGGVAAETLFRP